MFGTPGSTRPDNLSGIRFGRVIPDHNLSSSLVFGGLECKTLKNVWNKVENSLDFTKNRNFKKSPYCQSTVESEIKVPG